MTNRIDTASRLINAPATAVYAAFAEADAYLAWLPPLGMTGEVHDWDFRDGGGYRMRLTYADATGAPGKSTDDADDVEVRFLRIVAAQRIEQAVVFESEDAAFAGLMRMTWSFEEKDGATLVTVACEDVPPGIRPEDHEEGLTSSLANLATYLEGSS